MVWLSSMGKSWSGSQPNLGEHAGYQRCDQHSYHSTSGLTMDKLEIIDIAQEIDTFEISIQPFEDCCTIFAPDRPKTNPKIKNAEQYEKHVWMLKVWLSEQ